MAIIDDYNKKQEYEANKLKFFLDFDKYLDSFSSNGVKLKDLLKFIIDENKKYTITDLDYTFMVRAEEEKKSNPIKDYFLFFIQINFYFLTFVCILLVYIDDLFQ